MSKQSHHFPGVVNQYSVFWIHLKHSKNMPGTQINSVDLEWTACFNGFCNIKFVSEFLRI